jgi:hypothetical protein
MQLLHEKDVTVLNRWKFRLNSANSGEGLRSGKIGRPSTMGPINATQYTRHTRGLDAAHIFADCRK